MRDGRISPHISIPREGRVSNQRWAAIDLDNTPNDQDLRLKIESVLTTAQQLLTWIVEHHEELEYQGYFVATWQDPRAIQNSTAMLTRLKDVLTKVAGNINGYHKELQWASRQIRKAETTSGDKRRIHFGARGDVAVDYGGGFGAAMQSKSCFASGYRDVDNHLQKAALQLTGEKVALETPGAQDRRIADISIRNPNNRWPKTDADLSQVTLGDIVQRIHSQVATYVQNKRGYNKWNELSNNLGTTLGKGSKGQPISRTTVPTTTNVGIDFIVKIRWDQPRPVLVPGNLLPVNIRQVTTRTEKNVLNNTVTTQCIQYK